MRMKVMTRKTLSNGQFPGTLASLMIQGTRYNTDLTHPQQCTPHKANPKSHRRTLPDLPLLSLEGGAARCRFALAYTSELAVQRLIQVCHAHLWS